MTPSAPGSGRPTPATTPADDVAARTGARRATRPSALALALVAVVAAVTACTAGGGGDGDGGTQANSPRTLRVLASSELADMEPVLDEAHKATGVTVRPTYVGTLDAVEQIASGAAEKSYDAVWLSSNDYLRLRPDTAKKITGETPIMTSPVALGIRPGAVARLGWDPAKVTWSQIHRAVAEKKLGYGMTDPARSNSGFSALVSIASGLSGAQSALTEKDVAAATPKLKEFFGGQKLTSGSSGWLATAWSRRTDVDALINYESVLLNSAEKLTVVRPADGVVTADYPFTLLTSASRDAKQAAASLTAHLRTPSAQRMITNRTLRRPVVPGVELAEPLTADQRRELPFPGSRSVADGLLDAYENKLRRPSRTVYVLDTSGSMEGERLARLRSALAELTGDFRDRETVTLMPFGSAVKQGEVRTYTVDPAAPQTAIDAMRAQAGGLSASGGTAIYSSLKEAYEHLGTAPDGDTFTSIVLMTDGENTDGEPAAAFDSFYRGRPPAQRRTPVFPILFGDSDRTELDHIASLTGGRLFDATKGSLDGAFEEIRGYQ
ncbi:VWA domain-containing protein [Streptomyces sp. NBC_01353]|uniref:VWA domain-containing protein n=1 Tax=Streptomyces sp. NBC_01353 TaxID=2903835 RepID=UPI002E332560|nr:VWA domain-containing protein [Streptomyces sp. NBC_01353]